MKKLYKVLAATLVLSLTACQQNFPTAKSPAMKAAEAYVKTVNASFPKVNAKNNSSTRGFNNNPFGGFVYQPWQQWGGYWGSAAQHGVYGNALMYPSMTDETYRCQQMVDQIPRKVQNLEFMIGTLERCLFRLAINKAAPMNYLWRNEDAQILNYAGYLNDYARPAQYGTYDYSAYLPFLLQGQTGYLQ